MTAIVFDPGHLAYWHIHALITHPMALKITAP
jgi:hypothetical protein